MSTQRNDIHSVIVAEIITAVRAYEEALACNDLSALSDWFCDDPGTLRADAQGVLIGRGAIDDFRRHSGGALPRVVERLHVVPLAESAGIAIAETRRGDGTRGLQTQAWVRTPQGWKIAAAHVSVSSPATASPPRPDESATWRVRGAPLIPAVGRGPLSGLSLAVKDLFAVSGHAIGAGNPTWLAEAAVEPTSAAAVQLLLDAGASVVGIAQTDEFAYSLGGTNVHYGTPPNPAAAGRVPGGSSSGPASAIAAGLADIGLGTDTAGSVRVPASYCGLFGFRPTHGAVPTVGLLPLAPGFDTVGWLTRDVTTLQAVAEVLLPAGDPTPPERLLLTEDLFGLADPATREALREPAERLAEEIGLPVTKLPVLYGEHLQSWMSAFGTVQAAQAWQIRGPWLAQHPDALEPEIAQRFAAGRAVTPEQLHAAEQVLSQARLVLDELLSPGTVLLQPAASTVAPLPHMSAEDKAPMRTATLRLTCAASIAGLPAVALPGGRIGGLPVGLCLVGRRGTDRSLIALAR